MRFNRRLATTITHELAEPVTDPNSLGWNDEGKGDSDEIGDISRTLFSDGFITADQFYDLLTGADDTTYAVERVWSNQDRAPVAFASVP
jgi:hypothetical protein